MVDVWWWHSSIVRQWVSLDIGLEIGLGDDSVVNEVLDIMLELLAVVSLMASVLMVIAILMGAPIRWQGIGQWFGV